MNKHRGRYGTAQVTMLRVSFILPLKRFQVWCCFSSIRYTHTHTLAHTPTHTHTCICLISKTLKDQVLPEGAGHMKEHGPAVGWLFYMIKVLRVTARVTLRAFEAWCAVTCMQRWGGIRRLQRDLGGAKWEGTGWEIQYGRRTSRREDG